MKEKFGREIDLVAPLGRAWSFDEPIGRSSKRSINVETRFRNYGYGTIERVYR